MSKEAYPKQDDGKIVYAHASSVVAGEALFLAGIGVIIATAAYGAAESGVYETEGDFQFPIASGVTIAAGNKCYWDKSANNVIITGMAAEDFYLGRAISAGSAAGGYVDIRIGGVSVDYQTAGGVLPKEVIVLSGTAVITAGNPQVIAISGLLSTDRPVVSLISAGVDTSAVALNAVPSDGSLSVRFNTPATSAGLSYLVARAV